MIDRRAAATAALAGDTDDERSRSHPRRRRLVMARPHCPRCRGALFFTAEDNLPRLSCLACGRSFVPAREPAITAQAA